MRVGITSEDDNSSQEHSLSHSRSKFSSTGGNLGNEITPPDGSIRFHGNFGVFSILMTEFSLMPFSCIVKRFPEHSLSPLGSNISSNESKLRGRPPTPFMGVLIWFHGNSGVFSIYLTEIALLSYQRVKWGFRDICYLSRGRSLHQMKVSFMTGHPSPS